MFDWKSTKIFKYQLICIYLLISEFAAPTTGEGKSELMLHTAFQRTTRSNLVKTQNIRPPSICTKILALVLNFSSY